MGYAINCVRIKEVSIIIVKHTAKPNTETILFLNNFLLIIRYEMTFLLQLYYITKAYIITTALKPHT